MLHPSAPTQATKWEVQKRQQKIQKNRGKRAAKQVKRTPAPHLNQCSASIKESGKQSVVNSRGGCCMGRRPSHPGCCMGRRPSHPQEASEDSSEDEDNEGFIKQVLWEVQKTLTHRYCHLLLQICPACPFISDINLIRTLLQIIKSHATITRAW